MASARNGELRYLDKVTIVTGGSKGIGEGIVREFVKAGSKVVFCARGDVAGKKLECEVNAMGPGESMFLQCDVTKQNQLKNLVDKTIEKYGQLDCLINNAGWHPPEKNIDDTSIQDFKNLLDLNLVNYFTLCKLSLPHLRKTKGNIINVSSLVAQIGQANAVAYVTTKGAISSMTRALAVDEAKYGVRVNTLSPGNVWTPLWDELAKQTSNFEKSKLDGEEAQLLGRMGTLEESGKSCLYLAADATFTTGIDLFLSGGAELNYGRKTRLDQ
ncbi:17-beta-hydroxysteroid dehydrogenase 14 [Exaiptasia diaphana]|uniref:17-beta-hydroxysteroid dehydrogenase 14 n=1 Tax=Exaiptasia diaphana TaxID=2652724 RepID=A0A913WU02_EXADI|nr:17-beta-hydroxysteroid dehydrogenase 14 [Exaiptasia diaphana]KXJ20962.1 17-beta-hydroxysteroid dehydrogenase 14 [Exaiptasia diaphana]